MRYPLAEKFKSIQGEGLHTGQPMAFIRMVGCSVGKGVCHACDTDFDKMYPELGGGSFTPLELTAWAHPYPIICITGGEPLDRQLRPLTEAAQDAHIRVHVETSGTVPYDPLRHGKFDWITVSPKPGFLQSMINRANELKVILGGLGDGPDWPTLKDALRWGQDGHLVYLQPRNLKHEIDHGRMKEVLDLADQYPGLRVSTQFHKYLSIR